MLFWYSHHIPFWTLVDGDPHFMIELPDRHDALCFNINDKPGTIFNLVRDPVSGRRNCWFHTVRVDFWSPCVFLQAFWSTAKLLETRKSLLMVSLTPTFTDLASPTGLSGWGWRWTQRSSQCTRVVTGSSCCGQKLRLWKDPSKRHGSLQ